MVWKPETRDWERKLILKTFKEGINRVTQSCPLLAFSETEDLKYLHFNSLLLHSLFDPDSDPINTAANRYDPWQTLNCRWLWGVPEFVSARRQISDLHTAHTSSLSFCTSSGSLLYTMKRCDKEKKRARWRSRRGGVLFCLFNLWLVFSVCVISSFCTSCRPESLSSSSSSSFIHPLPRAKGCCCCSYCLGFMQNVHIHRET